MKMLISERRVLEKLSSEVRYSLVSIIELKIAGNLSSMQTKKIVTAAHESKCYDSLIPIQELFARGVRFY